MATDKQLSAASRRRARVGGWVLSRLQVILAACGIAVGFLLCFALGFLSGVWFQAQEQMTPHADAVALAEGQLDREPTVSSPEREMTFYDTLPSTAPHGATAPASPPQAVAPPPPQAPAPKAAKPKVAPPAATAAPFYSVQVGSFRSAEQAYDLQNQLLKKGYKARIGLSMVPGSGAWYRVRVGRYADRGAADKTAQRLHDSEKMNVLVMRESS